MKNFFFCTLYNSVAYSLTSLQVLSLLFFYSLKLLCSNGNLVNDNNPLNWITWMLWRSLQGGGMLVGTEISIKDGRLDLGCSCSSRGGPCRLRGGGRLRSLRSGHPSQRSGCSWLSRRSHHPAWRRLLCWRPCSWGPSPRSLRGRRSGFASC
jgi:hypothetical protein